MKLNIKPNRIKNYTYELVVFISCLILFLLIFCIVSNAQGLINNGAAITINNANLTVEGGATIGNFTNQDFGASTGVVQNTGTLIVSGDWTNNSSQHVFTSNSGTVNLSGNSQSIAGSTPTYFNNLSLTGAGATSLGVDALTGGGFVFPSGTLSLGNNQLDLNTHTLTVNNPSAAAITRLNGFIISESNAAFNPSIIQWNTGVNTGNYIFPFGSSNGYSPVGIIKSTSANSDLSASTRATKFADNLPLGSGVTHLNSPVIGGPGAVPAVIDRWYYVSASSPIVVDINFTYAGVENTTTFSPTGIFGMQNWTGVWQPPAGTGPGVTVGTATVSALSQTIGPINNNWVLTNILVPLPIELLSFDAKCDGKKNVRISWQTASELNVSNYIIQRSIDGIHFLTMAVIPPQVNFTGVKNYNWVDNNPANSLSYYRLVERDINGEETIFKVTAVGNCKSENGEPNIYSSGTSIYFDMNTSENNKCSIEVFDASGKLVLNKLQLLDNSTKSFKIETNLADGIYFVKCLVGNNVFSRKVLLNAL